MIKTFIIACHCINSKINIQSSICKVYFLNQNINLNIDQQKKINKNLENSTELNKLNLNDLHTGISGYEKHARFMSIDIKRPNPMHIFTQYM